MTIENGGEQPANDTALTQAADTATQAAENTEAPEGEDTANEDGEPAEPEVEDVDYEGAKYRVPKTIKDALLRQADYTRKTQELAEHRKAFDSEREGFSKSQESRQRHFQDAAKVIAFNDQLAELDGQISKYANVDWAALSQQNPDGYQQHRVYYDSLRDRKGALTEQRDTAARTWTQKEQEYAEQSNRERGERVAKAQAELPKLIEGWTPELDTKLGNYGIALGLDRKFMFEAVLQEPKAAVLFHKAYLYDEQQKKQKTQQTFQQSQQAAPVTRVGGNGGTAQQRKTTDSSGDALSMETWVARERERLKTRKA